MNKTRSKLHTCFQNINFSSSDCSLTFICNENSLESVGQNGENSSHQQVVDEQRSEERTSYSPESNTEEIELKDSWEGLIEDGQPIKFFTKDEVVVHNRPEDFWLIIHGWVLDLTSMLQKRRCSMTPVSLLILNLEIYLITCQIWSCRLFNT